MQFLFGGGGVNNMQKHFWYSMVGNVPMVDVMLRGIAYKLFYSSL